MYKIITEKIIGKLEKGALPWHQLMDEFQTVNLKNTKAKALSRNNIFSVGRVNMVPKNRFLEAGGRIKKRNSKIHIIVY